MTSTTTISHPLRVPTPPRGIRQVDYVGRHRLPDPSPSLWRRALAVLLSAVTDQEPQR